MIVVYCMSFHYTTTLHAAPPMRRTDDKPTVGWTARVPALHKQALESVLSATSGKTWFVRTGLQQFNDECETRPTLQAAVTESILAMRGEEPPRFLEDFIVRVPVQEYTRFNQMFPDKGATTWFMRNLIAKYIEQSEDRPTPDVHVLEAVRGILKF